VHQERRDGVARQFVPETERVKHATIRDVARAANVSVATVSRVLNRSDPVSEAARERVLAAATELDYVPHSGARSLSTRRTDTIGVILPDLHGEFFSELIRGIDLATRAKGLHLLLSHSHGDPNEAITVLRAMRSRVDALVVMSPYADEGVVAALGGRTPVVLLGGGGEIGGHPRFEIDNHAGAYAMTSHLLDAGYRRIAFISGPAGNIEAARRLAGYRDALAAHGEAIEQVVQGDFGEESGYRVTRRLITDARPEAIFAGNDMMAIGCLQALREAGLRVPDDIALAGFDDIPIARFVDPPLTTVGVPIAELGRQAVECCVQILAGGAACASRTFTPELVVRASTTIDRHNRRKSRAKEGEADHERISID
jgi:LacI family transcriptional regulator